MNLPFFVYGTLRPGEINHDRFLRGRTAREEPALLRGAVLYEGPGYPYAVEAPECEVRGELVTARPEAYAELLALLDRLEEYVPGDPGTCTTGWSGRWCGRPTARRSARGCTSPPRRSRRGCGRGGRGWRAGTGGECGEAARGAPPPGAGTPVGPRPVSPSPPRPAQSARTPPLRPPSRS